MLLSLIVALFNFICLSCGVVSSFLFVAYSSSFILVVINVHGFIISRHQLERGSFLVILVHSEMRKMRNEVATRTSTRIIVIVNKI